MILALIVGCVLAFQSYYIWTLHGQATELQSEVARLHNQVCNYQAAAMGLADELAAAGLKPLPVPPHPEPCP